MMIPLALLCKLPQRRATQHARCDVRREACTACVHGREEQSYVYGREGMDIARRVRFYMLDAYVWR